MVIKECQEDCASTRGILSSCALPAVGSIVAGATATVRRPHARMHKFTIDKNITRGNCNNHCTLLYFGLCHITNDKDITKGSCNAYHMKSRNTKYNCDFSIYFLDKCVVKYRLSHNLGTYILYDQTLIWPIVYLVLFEIVPWFHSSVHMARDFY